ncbi:MAG: Ig-like domain-containing protein [Bacilli bacterium]|nr:Ig-like domain-containing protein [Bacilli bacterium]
MKKFIGILTICFLLLLTSCSQNSSTQINSIEIIKDEVLIEELEVLVNDEFTLNTQINDNLKTTLVWESSNPNIILVDNNGNVKVLNKGQAVITVSVKDAPYLNDSVFINASTKVEQIGVGSGLSKDDPIFLGNEGEDEPIEVYFIEMQHIYADSIFIKKGNVEVLIDAGFEYDGNYVNKVLTQYCADDRLDLFMVSHSDGDHVDGIANALSTVDDISLMIDYGGQGTGNVLATRNKYIPKGMIYHSAYDCINHLNGATDVYYLTEDFYFEVLNTGNYITSEKTSASNPHSLAVIFYYKNFSFFTAGDITTATEAQLLKNEDLPEVTLYKASHHGSHGSNSQELLDTLNPKAVAISAARANQYQVAPTGPQEGKTYNLNGASGHPAAAAIERIYKAPNISQNLNVYWNAVNGTMKFTSYGKNDFTFTGSTTMKGYYDLSITGGVAVWNKELQDFENKVTGEENFKLHETKVFQFRNYIQYLPNWAKEEYFPEYNG